MRVQAAPGTHLIWEGRGGSREAEGWGWLPELTASHSVRGPWAWARAAGSSEKKENAPLGARSADLLGFHRNPPSPGCYSTRVHV